MIDPREIKEIILGTDGKIYLILFNTGNAVKKMMCLDTEDSKVIYGAEIKGSEGKMIVSDSHGKTVLEVSEEKIFRMVGNGEFF